MKTPHIATVDPGKRGGMLVLYALTQLVFFASEYPESRHGGTAPVLSV